MNGLTSYLSKYTSLGTSQRKQKEVVAKAVSEVCGVPVHPSQISIEFGTARTQVQSSVRWILYENKAEVLKRIESELGPKQITDVS